MSIIDEELAKAFLDDPDNVDLSEATNITDGAAESLSKYEGQLWLASLTELRFHPSPFLALSIDSAV